MSPSPPYYTGQEVTFTASLSPSELAGDCASQISWTYTEEVGDVVTTCFNNAGTGFREYAILGSGCPLGVSQYFDVYRVKITKPRPKSEVSPDSSVFHTDTPYCYHNQAVTSGSLGDTESKIIRGITGSVSPSASYWWSLDPDAGSIDPLTGSLSPDHNSPSTTGSGTLKLALASHSSIYDTTYIEIYEDHLARDLANFKDGKYCDGPEELGLQLGDGSYMNSAVTLTCASSARHALDGTKSSGQYFRDQVSNGNWQYVATTEYDIIKNYQCQRGWILELRETSNGPEGHSFVHWQTVKAAGTIENLTTYAADSDSEEFRHEKVKDYFDMKQIDLDDAWVKVYKP
jgi:hypothetical protein